LQFAGLLVVALAVHAPTVAVVVVHLSAAISEAVGVLRVAAARAAFAAVIAPPHAVVAVPHAASPAELLVALAQFGPVVGVLVFALQTPTCRVRSIIEHTHANAGDRVRTGI
jgi:hypothetical protein